MKIKTICAFCGAEIDPVAYMREHDEIVFVVGCQCQVKDKPFNEALASLERGKYE